MVPHRVEPHLARGSHQWMPVQDHDFPARLPRSCFSRLLKSSSSPANNLSLNPPIFRNAAASTKMNEPASQQPIRLDQFQSQVKNSAIKCFSSIRTVEPPARHRPDWICSATSANSSRARTRICVHKNQPVAGGRRRAAIAGAGNLIERFKDNHCARCMGYFRRAIGGIVVANNQFKFPTAQTEDIRR